MGRTFEDFPVGKRLVSREETVTGEAIVEFARRYDPQPFHLVSDPG
jgi:acyl dehydratase